MAPHPLGILRYMKTWTWALNVSSDLSAYCTDQSGTGVVSEELKKFFAAVTRSWTLRPAIIGLMLIPQKYCPFIVYIKLLQ